MSLDLKLADLKRAAAEGLKPPHDEYEVAGDRTYAPPELLYHHVPPDWRRRRYGCDAYLLGSMIVYMFTGLGTTALMISELDFRQRPGQWTGTYEDILPAVRNAFSKVLMILKGNVPDCLQEQLVGAVRSLCDPDPALRGHPKNRPDNQLSLERYITEFDLYASRARARHVWLWSDLSGFVEEKDRKIIPRWRSFSRTASRGELDSLGTQESKTIPDEIFEGKLREWEHKRILPFASEVVASAIVLGREKGGCLAANFILTFGDNVPPAGT